jgi:hypothetical protein
LGASSRIRLGERRTISAKGFSFLTNPIGTIKILTEIAEAETCCLSSRIDFEGEKCLDIGATLVLAAMRKDMMPIFEGGIIKEETAKVIEVDLSRNCIVPLIAYYAQKENIYNTQEVFAEEKFVSLQMV